MRLGGPHGSACSGARRHRHGNRPANPFFPFSIDLRADALTSRRLTYFRTLAGGERDAPAAHFTLGPARELNGVLVAATPGHDTTPLFARLRDRDFANAIWRDFTHRQVESEGGTGTT